jgi:hypothetical protein
MECTKHNNNYNNMSRCRVKLKPHNKLSIYDVFIIKMLRDTSDELYLYIDDRSIPPHDTQKLIDDTINILHMFNIKMPEMIVRYTDYYETAWIYLHRLITINKAIVNYNTVCRSSDLHMMAKTKNIKLFYNNTMHHINNRYNTILYDCGWFRDLFIEIVMDHSERIDMIIDDTLGMDDINKSNDDKQSHGDLLDKTIFLTDLRSDLKFNMPEKVLTTLITTIKHMEKENNTSQCSIASPNLSKISISCIHKLGIDIKLVRTIIENTNDSLLMYAHKLTYIDTKIQDKMTHSIRILFNKCRDVNLAAKKNMIIKGVYLECSDILVLNLDPKNLQNHTIHIRSLGCVTIGQKYPNYTGVFIKAKNKKQHLISKWTPIDTLSCDKHIINCNIYKLDSSGEHTSSVISVYEDTSDDCSNKMYSLNSELYIADDDFKTPELTHTLIDTVSNKLPNNILNLIPWNIWIQSNL